MEFYELKDIEQNYNRTLMPLNRGFLESSYLTALADMGRTQPFSAAYPTQYPSPYQQQYFVDSRIMKANLTLADAIRLSNTTIDSTKEEVQQYLNIIQKMLDDGVFDPPSPETAKVPQPCGYGWYGNSLNFPNLPKPENTEDMASLVEKLRKNGAGVSDRTLSDEQKTLAEE